MEWLLVPPVSGSECVHALQKCGFAVESASVGEVTLKGNGKTVCVPTLDMLAVDVLVTILLTAHITPARFLRLLDE